MVADVLREKIDALLAGGKGVRLELPAGGELVMEQPLPFVCLHVGRPETSFAMRRLLSAQASHMWVEETPKAQKQGAKVLGRLIEKMASRFGSFFVLELFASASPENEGEKGSNGEATRLLRDSTPAEFRLRVLERDANTPSVIALRKALRQIKLFGHKAEVSTSKTKQLGLLGISAKRLSGWNCQRLQMDVRHLYGDTSTDVMHLRKFRAFYKKVDQALKQAFFSFSWSQTPYQPPHYLALGKKRTPLLAKKLDAALVEISGAFDFLIDVTPMNSHAAWLEFKRRRFEKVPFFVYPSLTIEPDLIKRRLYQLSIEKLDDPTMAQLFYEKRDQLDRQITMLLDRNTPRFHYGSLQLYGKVSETLLKEAHGLLEQIPPRARESSKVVSTQEFIRRAEEEIAYYRGMDESFNARVVPRPEIVTLLVSQGNLLLNEDLELPASRVEALLHHEVGTHCLTYHNGKSQTLGLMGNGFAGYEELQEGLAVLSEYLCGGLSRPRLRLLAGRVVAAHSIQEDATFLETYRLLHRQHGFPRHTAFVIAMRVHRGGGLTKDLVYLRGLLRLLEYLRKGGELEPLFVGKIATKHVPLVQELLWRKILRPGALRPRVLDLPMAQERLETIRAGLSLQELARTSKRRKHDT